MKNLKNRHFHFKFQQDPKFPFQHKEVGGIVFVSSFLRPKITRTILNRLPVGTTLLAVTNYRHKGQNFQNTLDKLALHLFLFVALSQNRIFVCYFASKSKISLVRTTPTLLIEPCIPTIIWILNLMIHPFLPLRKGL